MSSDDNPLVFGSFRQRVARRRLRAFAQKLLGAVARGRAFSCLITADKELQRLNREFRGKDYPTDVLSFPSFDRSTLGDIAISIDRAAEQARRFQHPLEDEIGILMLHGLLHLMGLDHETDRGQMARVEARWRKKLGLPGSLIQRAASC
jgi:probable rRNA maturation factor